MCSAPPAATAIFLVLSLGIGDRDAARRRLEIAVEIVDRENAQIDGRRFGRDGAASAVVDRERRIGLRRTRWK